MATNVYLENYVPAIKDARALLTKYPITSLSTSPSAFSGALTVNGFTNTGGSVGSLATEVTMTTATFAPTSAQSGTYFLFNRAGGVTVTLPAPVVGCVFNFVVQTTPTSPIKVITDTGTTLLQGAVVVSGTTAVAFQSLITSSNISFNGNVTTTGGLVGTEVKFLCLSSTLWQVTGISFGSGTVATPFANS